MMRYVLACVLLGLIGTTIATTVFATAQEPDVIIIGGERYFIHTNPLEVYLSDYPDKRPKPEIISSANWRGYIATWEVRGNILLLTDVMVEVASEDGPRWATAQRSVMEEMFPGMAEVVAEWFTGHIVVPTGELVDYVHMGYGSTYEKYSLIRVVGGAVEAMWDADAKLFEQFRKRQFERFKETDDYRYALEELKDEKFSDSLLEEFIYNFYSEVYLSAVFDE